MDYSVEPSIRINVKQELTMDEIWKDIEGYEGLYQVSNYGRVKSLRNK